jgi:hypothetical protein
MSIDDPRSDVSLNEVLLGSAEAGLSLQRSDGSMPEGHNGPHRHVMTAARNTAHWAILFLGAFERTHDGRYVAAAESALGHLLSQTLWPFGKAFHHRLDVRKDAVNGLIGQAWTLEALAYASRILKNDEYRRAGLEVAEAHPFDQRQGLWHRITLSGADAGLETTANQQVWFAAASSLLQPDPSAVLHKRIVAFMDRATSNLSTRRAGIFRLAIQKGWTARSLARSAKARLLVHQRAIREKEVAYHGFQLTGLAYLYCAFPDHSYWQTPSFRKALLHAFTTSFIHELEDNRFAFAYNVPGFELPFVFRTFQPLAVPATAEHACGLLVRRQIGDHYDQEAGLMRLKTSDPDTLAARSYELTRLLSDRWSDH